MAEQPELPVDATLFTASQMDAAQQHEVKSIQQMSEEKDKGKRQKKMTEKVMAQMLKPPPVSLVRDKIKREEKAQHEAEEVEKRKIMGKIIKYTERFPELLAKIPRISARTSLAEAMEILSQIHEAMNSAASMRNIFGMMSTGFSVLEHSMSDKKFVEKLPEKCRYDLRGLTKSFCSGQFPDLAQLIAELDVEYPWLGRRPLLLRTISTLMDTLTKVHLSNTNPAARKIIEMSNVAPVNLDDGSAE